MAHLIEHLAIGQTTIGQGTITGLSNANLAPASASSSISVNIINGGSEVDFVSWQSTIVVPAAQTDTVTQVVKGRMSPDHGWVTLDTHSIVGSTAGTYSRAATLVKMAEYCSEVTVIGAVGSTCRATLLA